PTALETRGRSGAGTVCGTSADICPWWPSGRPAPRPPAVGGSRGAGADDRHRPAHRVRPSACRLLGERLLVGGLEPLEHGRCPGGSGDAEVDLAQLVHEVLPQRRATLLEDL